MTITAAIIDSREPEWVQKLTFGGLPTSVQALTAGDLMAACDDGHMLLIERKTPDDFLGSLRDERLLPQLGRMMDQTRWSYLVITGDFLRGSGGHVVTDRGETGWQWTAIQGALLTIQEMGVFVVFAAGDSDYESCITRLSHRDRKPDMLIAPARIDRLMSAQEAVMAALPGIGSERVRKVLDYCGTPAWGLVGLTDATTTIPGIPQSVKLKIRAALGLLETQQMVVINDDHGNEVLQVAQLGTQ